MDNGLAPLFRTDRAENTRRVLEDTANVKEFPDTRARLVGWRNTRADVDANLDGFERVYTPFAKGLEALEGRMNPSCWDHIGAVHRTYIGELVGIAGFVASVRRAIARFDEGLSAVGEGRMSVDDLSGLHREMVDAYKFC